METTGADTLYGAYSIPGFSNSSYALLPLVMYGGAANDTLVGSDSADVIYGGSGDDRVEARGGNDSVSGEDGNDYLKGEGGSDVLVGGNGADELEGRDGGVFDQMSAAANGVTTSDGSQDTIRYERNASTLASYDSLYYNAGVDNDLAYATYI